MLPHTDFQLNNQPGAAKRPRTDDPMNCSIFNIPSDDRRHNAPRMEGSLNSNFQSFYQKEIYTK